VYSCKLKKSLLYFVCIFIYLSSYHIFMTMHHKSTLASSRFDVTRDPTDATPGEWMSHLPTVDTCKWRKWRRPGTTFWPQVQRRNHKHRLTTWAEVSSGHFKATARSGSSRLSVCVYRPNTVCSEWPSLAIAYQPSRVRSCGVLFFKSQIRSPAKKRTVLEYHVLVIIIIVIIII